MHHFDFREEGILFELELELFVSFCSLNHVDSEPIGDEHLLILCKNSERMLAALTESIAQFSRVCRCSVYLRLVDRDTIGRNHIRDGKTLIVVEDSSHTRVGNGHSEGSLSRRIVWIVKLGFEADLVLSYIFLCHFIDCNFVSNWIILHESRQVILTEVSNQECRIVDLVFTWLLAMRNCNFLFVLSHDNV